MIRKLIIFYCFWWSYPFGSLILLIAIVNYLTLRKMFLCKLRFAAKYWNIFNILRKDVQLQRK